MNDTVERTIMMHVLVHGTVNRGMASTVTIVLGTVNVMNSSLVIRVLTMQVNRILTTTLFANGAGITPTLMTIPSVAPYRVPMWEMGNAEANRCLDFRYVQGAT